ncbi:MAG: hypothetical protein A3C79_03075 [Candidatus Taylorbacteria bacterium RIFCSPHIGHO2_02_FULL_45_28]|uniref:Uncharacterized protein n=1 Tax=Candidatus Taylorbacteria bacterium RIFCSPHIGHO2_12_FULL_45_16 TaxID=1802315 RepID=A0A1G2N0Z0_9BACT|nr:MAG: hypothetical protein A2830_00795 [Candidatus Taylorbacteria bacterium RIFCSPHIGHO2_01_FULL_44_110]OHA24940.1 MAG: hypothetical protein A3C79_03075 [Candidatus Taylorbacteria bacterium RIFCSPHIGHO2_02_FULL_45_28]OHA29758.1 MAG: hypothetical protein A3F51_03490 [Candidatus Taylorbacteria bacterium RIFCSPHIGHO2_12_FULL_45_16]OHA32702.1 MAG: hypothetical protein A3A23_00360 [Candidatus Taylorbacteria bacterium RIFCSPLOWO2_01_FULL_45_59]OHA39276.1 MAG: hypothetical protein A3I98_01350 [Candi
MYSKDLKIKGKLLREQGYSYAYISGRLKVAKSTLSIWLKDVRFFPNSVTKNSIINSQKQVVLTRRADKARSIEEAERYAGDSVGKLSSRDVFLLGIGIYIGEGSKAFNTTRIVNSDPRIIKFSLAWLKKCFGVKADNIRIRLHVYPDTNSEKAVAYWMKELDVSKKVFQTSYVDRRLNKKKSRAGVLPYGTAHMTVVSNGNKNFGVLLHRKILATIDRILTMRD